MKKTIVSSIVLLSGALVWAQEPFRQTYPVTEEAANRMRERVESDLSEAEAPWRAAPLSYYVVSPLSDVPRLPDRFPADGEALGALEYIAAQGEYRPASFQVAPRRAVDRFLPRAGALHGPGGAAIPASALDIKVVKVWYQSGAAWYGYFADALGRRLVPELLLNDETLIRVDHDTRDDYVRYANMDGSEHYQWMSANFRVVNYSMANQANMGLIHDADELQPAVLNPWELKQFFVTLHVPEEATPGIYTGQIELLADDVAVGSLPVRVRVLPFQLPRARTYYDHDKEFHLALYGTGARNPKVLKNLAAHNLLTPMGFPSPNPMNPDQLVNDLALAREAGIATRPLFRIDTMANLRVDQENPTAEELLRVENLRRQIETNVAQCRELLGHADLYSYGVDEGGPDTVRKERNAWRAVHQGGGKVMVSTHPRGRLLFALDYMIMPRMPAESRSAEVRAFHDANPDGLVGWYADPHTGPENPDYFRRIHGMMAYKAGYDASSNYTWWRNNWNDMATPYEHNLRNLVMVLATRDDVIDTLAWEGVREGIDDIRYATKLKDLAREAMTHSDADVRLLGRRALGVLAQWDAYREDVRTFRLESIRYILELMAALDGDKA